MSDLVPDRPYTEALIRTLRDERDEARKEITLMGAELDEARTALTEACELLNGTRFGVTPSELLLIEDFLAQQRHPAASQEAPK